MASWVASDPSLNKESSINYVQSNKLAIKNGCITAGAMKMYIDAHPNIRLKEDPVVDDGTSAHKNANHEGPFGVKTK